MAGLRTRRRYGWVAAAILVATVLVETAPLAHADEAERIAQLSATLGDGHSERERIAAVTALAKLGDAALRPLVNALRDGSPSVRGIAAAGLGKLGHRAALPALRQAQADADVVVQKRAAEAIVQICAANNLPPEGPATATVGAKVVKPGFGNQPRAVAPRPDLYVVIKSSSDDSPGKHDKKARQVHAEVLRDAMSTELAGASLVTLTAADAKKYGLDPRQLDLSIVGLDVRQDGAFIEVEAQVRLAISNDAGKMLSFVSGGAKVQVPRRGYNAGYLPQLRRDAVENAVRGLFSKMMDQLRRSLTS